MDAFVEYSPSWLEARYYKLFLSLTDIYKKENGLLRFKKAISLLTVIASFGFVILVWLVVLMKSIRTSSIPSTLRHGTTGPQKSFCLLSTTKSQVITRYRFFLISWMLISNNSRYLVCRMYFWRATHFKDTFQGSRLWGFFWWINALFGSNN